MSGHSELEVKSDDASYYVIWRPVVTICGAGSTQQEAWEDLREATHCWADSFIGLNLKGVIEEAGI